MQREQLNHRFQEIYTGLNEEQRKAVDRIYGHVLVIAGPGTGKTQILSARIGKILLETDYLPDNILCLTYTDAGRVAMRKRLQSMIGADAYRVAIHTFHSYCNQIIQENPSVFQKNTLDAVSDLERIRFLRQLIDEFTAENPLKRYRGEVYYDLNNLSALFSTMKREGWSSKFIQQCIGQYLNDLPLRDKYIYKRAGIRDGKPYAKGDLKEHDLEAERQKKMVLWHAAAAFDRYQQIMDEHHRYDFDDMIQWVLTAFQEDSHLLFDQQERYQFFLIDEYQDTSGSQNQLIDLLCSGQEQANIFVVGDDDQSIYRFQGANIVNLENYRTRYEKDLFDVVLKSNYRSVPAILKLSQAIIENNTGRLNVRYPHLVKELQARHPVRSQQEILPELRMYQNTFQEIAGISLEIQALIQQGVPPSSIAVLYKENKWGDEVLKFFKEKNIPFYSKRKENLFFLASAKKFIQILRFIAAEQEIPMSGDAYLFEILHFSQFKIPPFEIAKAVAQVQQENYKNKARRSLRTWIQDWNQTVNPTLFDVKPHPELLKTGGLLEKWIQDAYNTTLIQLVENILMEGGFIAEALQNEQHKMWMLDILRNLLDFIKDELHRDPDTTLQEILSTMDMMKEEGLEIALYRIYGNENGVNLMTIHGSKGLEFKYVFLMNSVRSVWEEKKGNNRGFSYPDNLFERSKGDKEENLEELRRLFFVAVTRAEEYLYISWSQSDEKEKTQEPTRFIAEIQEKLPLSVRHMNLDQDAMQDFLQIYLLRESRPLIEQGEQEVVRSLLERFEMNATALNNYLKCPLQFYYQSLIKVPTGRSENTQFGSAIHFALEKLFEKKKESSSLPTLKTMQDDFVWYMYRNRESFTPVGFKRRLEYGAKVLEALYEKNHDYWEAIQIFSVEKNFRNVVVDDIPLKGKIDRMDYDGQRVTIIDYKTGKPENALRDKMHGPTEKNPDGGDYWRQAVFYKILVEGYKLKSYQVAHTQFHFVEPLQNEQYLDFNASSIFVSPEDEGIVRAQIKDTWHKIQAHDFYTGCGKPECAWCNFVKENGVYTALQRNALQEGESDQEL